MAVPKAPDCGCFSRPAKPRTSRNVAFLENSVTQHRLDLADDSNCLSADGLGRGRLPGTREGRANRRGAWRLGEKRPARGLRPVLKSSIWEKWAQPLGDLNFKGHSEMNISNGSGVRDPQFEILRTEIMRAGRRACGDAQAWAQDDRALGSFCKRFLRLDTMPRGPVPLLEHFRGIEVAGWATGILSPFCCFWH